MDINIVKEALKRVKDNLSMFNGFYDLIRIVDPLNNKEAKIENGEVKFFNNLCYEFWKSNKACDNCISKRSYLENNTFIKIEKNKDKVFLIMSTPIEYKNQRLIVEILKDITNSGKLSEKNDDYSICTEFELDKINDVIFRDELTTVYNRRYLMKKLNEDLKQYEKISIIMVDIDHFKKINDTYGHLIGDNILRDFSKIILCKVLDYNCWIGRYGGDEFLIVLNDCDKEYAKKICNRINKIFSQTTFQYGDAKIKLSLSLGIYEAHKGVDDIHSIIKSVDKRMYINKTTKRSTHN